MNPILFKILATFGEQVAMKLGAEATKAIAKEVWGKEKLDSGEAEGLENEFKSFLVEVGKKL